MTNAERYADSIRTRNKRVLGLLSSDEGQHANDLRVAAQQLRANGNRLLASIYKQAAQDRERLDRNG